MSKLSPTCTSCIRVVTGTVMSIFWLSAFSPEMYLNSLQNILLWSSSARDLVQSCETSRRSIDSSNLVTKLRTPTRDQSLPAAATVAGSVASPVVQTQEAAG